MMRAGGSHRVARRRIRVQFRRGLAGTNAALVVYGQGLGAILVVEHKADSATPGGGISGLPTVSLNGVTAHELATQLGTVLEWQQGGRSGPSR